MVETVQGDMLIGAADIASYIGRNVRWVYYASEKKLLPIFKVGALLHMRKSTYQAHLARLEAAAIGGEAA